MAIKVKKQSAPKDPAGIKTYTFSDLPLNETIWAIAAGPDEYVHISVCCELTGGGTVHLYAYNTIIREMRHVLDVAKALGQNPSDGHATQGKVHFALCPSRDGYIYAATHASTPPLGDKEWKAHVMWNDPVKSYPGGHFFRYRHETGDYTDYGILYPNQGIGLMALDEDLGRLAGVTYPKGNLFFIDKDGKNFVDAGRISETYNLAMVTPNDGFAYTSDSYGYIVRLDLEKRKWEMLTSRVPMRRCASGRSNWMCDAALGSDGYVYGIGYSTPDLFRFKPTNTGPVVIENLGTFYPQEREWPKGGYPRGITFADDGRLYACYYNAYINTPYEVGIVRYDPETGKKEDLGPLYTDNTVRRYWRCVKGPDGKLYAGDVGRKPTAMIIIDPSELAPRSVG